MNVTKNFIIGIITYNRYDYLDDLIKDIIRQNVWPKQIYISDNGIGYHLKEKIDIPITIIKNAYNYGTCRGTNEIIKLNQNEDILFMCDDNYFIKNTSLESIFNKFTEEKNNNIHLIWCNHWASFIASKEWIKCVGLFDDNIWPCYHEDSDLTETIRKKANSTISHNCIGYKSISYINNCEETEVIGNRRGTGEVLIAPYYSDFKQRNLYYFLFKWKENNLSANDIHENTINYCINQKDVDLYKFEIEYSKNKIKDLNLYNKENYIYPFVDEILKLKELNITNIVEYKTQRAYVSRLLLHLNPKELISYDDKFDLCHDICHHLNYLFNYNISIKLLNTSDIIKQKTDLLVINKDCDVDIINYIDSNYILIFRKDIIEIKNYNCIKTIENDNLNMYLYKNE